MRAMFTPPNLSEDSTVNGPRSRCWTIEAKDCSELAVLHMARVGIDEAHAPYRRVRVRPAGSFLMATLEGAGRVLLEGRWQNVTPGTMCLAPPRVLNALVASPGHRWVFAWVRYDEPSWVSPLVGAASPLRLRAGAEDFGHVLSGLRREWEGARDAAQLHHWISLLHGLALRAARPWHSDSRVGQIWDVVANDLAFDWKLNSLAARCHVSAEHLRRLCRREFGRTPMEHVTYMRIRRAQSLLETTDHKLDHIAATVGYHSSDVLTRAFVRHVGVPPSHYRERR
ncbi:MAG: AraC family transcriptional regulator [Opitutaceae bacterium]|nr:AraC family transcriptional regulator [Opitutaceae bacterium]